MDNTLEQIPSLQLLETLDERAVSAFDYVQSTAKNFPLEKRRAIVQHITDCQSEVETHHEVPEFAKDLRNHLIHDFWDDLKTDSAVSRYNKQRLEDFAVIAAMNSPAHRSEIQEVLYNIVPEDIPEAKKKRDQANADYAQRLLQCRATFGYDVLPEHIDPNGRLTNEEFAQRLLCLRLTHGY